MPVPEARASRRLRLTVASVVAIYGLLVPTAVAELLGSDQLVPAANIATIVSAVLFAQAGLLFLLRWRLSGDARSCRLGVGALVYGFFVAPLTQGFGLAGFDTVHHAAGQAIAQSVVGIVAALVVVRAAVSDPVDSRLRPARAMVWAATVLAAACSAGYLVQRLVGMSFQPAVASVAAGLAAVAWFASAVSMARRDRRPVTARTTILAASLAVMGLGSGWWVVAMYVPVPFGLDASALAMAAGTLLAGAAGYALLLTLSHRHATAFRLQSLLRTMEQVHAWEEERVHDARSALQAVQAAVTALTRYRERLDEDARTNLELAVDAEMRRLAGLMASSAAGKGASRCEPFDVTVPVRAVVAAAALSADVRLETPTGRCEAVGNADDTARVLENLLDNARRYAVGTPIVVRVRPDGATVALSVADGGPGIPDSERELVFTRGGRGRAARRVDGSGLGLFAARRLMEDQGGSLVVEPGSGRGATFVARLPAAGHWNGERALAPPDGAAGRPPWLVGIAGAGAAASTGAVRTERPGAA
jgi:signal transduction histidine kinase